MIVSLLPQLWAQATILILRTRRSIPQKNASNKRDDSSPLRKQVSSPTVANLSSAKARTYRIFSAHGRCWPVTARIVTLPEGGKNGRYNETYEALSFPAPTGVFLSCLERFPPRSSIVQQLPLFLASPRPRPEYRAQSGPPGHGEMEEVRRDGEEEESGEGEGTRPVSLCQPVLDG